MESAVGHWFSNMFAADKSLILVYAMAVVSNIPVRLWELMALV